LYSQNWVNLPYGLSPLGLVKNKKLPKKKNPGQLSQGFKKNYYYFFNFVKVGGLPIIHVHEE